MRAIALLAVVALSGCATLVGIDEFGPEGEDGNSGSGSGSGSGSDDPSLPPRGDVPATLAIGGSGSLDQGEFGFPALANVSASFTRDNGDHFSMLTDSSGRFSFDVPTGGTPVTGFAHVRSGSGTFEPRHYIFDAITTQSFVVTAYTASRIEEFATVALTTQPLSSGFVFVQIVDAGGTQGVPGVTVDTQGVGALRYHSDQINGPGIEETVTGAFGAVWVFGVPPGSITLTATLGARRVSRSLQVPAATAVTARIVLP